MKKLLSAVTLAASVAVAPLAVQADAWKDQAQSNLDFLPQGAVSAKAAQEVQGQAIPLALALYLGIARQCAVTPACLHAVGGIVARRWFTDSYDLNEIRDISDDVYRQWRSERNGGVGR
ncbi:MAG: hypothetical protein AAF709_16145 [Pseudomonadota bacterium]